MGLSKSWVLYVSYASTIRAASNSSRACSAVSDCDPMVCSPPGASVHGILQAGILEQVAMPSSRESPQPRDRNCLLHWQAGSLPPCHQDHLGSPVRVANINDQCRDATVWATAHVGTGIECRCPKMKLSQVMHFQMREQSLRKGLSYLCTMLSYLSHTDSCLNYTLAF